LTSGDVSDDERNRNNDGDNESNNGSDLDETATTKSGKSNKSVSAGGGKKKAKKTDSKAVTTKKSKKTNAAGSEDTSVTRTKLVASKPKSPALKTHSSETKETGGSAKKRKNASDDLKPSVKLEKKSKKKIDTDDEVDMISSSAESDEEYVVSPATKRKRGQSIERVKDSVNDVSSIAHSASKRARKPVKYSVDTDSESGDEQNSDSDNRDAGNDSDDNNDNSSTASSSILENDDDDDDDYSGGEGRKSAADKKGHSIKISTITQRKTKSKTGGKKSKSKGGKSKKTKKNTSQKGGSRRDKA
jgi:hypothetical protein